jgi:hypothetical protein
MTSGTPVQLRIGGYHWLSCRVRFRPRNGYIGVALDEPYNGLRTIVVTPVQIRLSSERDLQDGLADVSEARE